MNGAPEVLLAINVVNALICVVGLTGNVLVVSMKSTEHDNVKNLFGLCLRLIERQILVRVV